MLNNNPDWKFKNITFNEREYRLYSEQNTESDFAVNMELVHKIHGLIGTFNFEVYYLTSSPKTNLSVKFKSKNKIDGLDESTQKIKDLQSKDIYYLYQNIYFEVLHLFPHLDKNNVYYYDLLVLVQKDFDISKISRYNFNLININNCEKIQKSGINYNFIKNLFENRAILGNNCSTKGDLKYDFKKLNMTKEEFIKEHNNNSVDYEFISYTNAENVKFHTLFNQNEYVKIELRLLCTHIIDFGREYYIEVNEFGKMYMQDDLYDSIGLFFTDFAELADIKTATLENGDIKVKDLDYYHSTLTECFYEMDINSMNFTKEYVLNGKINFDNKDVRISKNNSITQKKRLW